MQTNVKHTEDTDDAKPRRLTPVESCKLLKEQMRRHFPGTKFSVTGDRGTAYGSADVSWTDGPTAKEVDVVCQPFVGKQFEGMDDSTHYIKTAITLDSGEVVQSGLGYISTHWTNGPEAIAKAIEQIQAEGWTEVYPGASMGMEGAAYAVLRGCTVQEAAVAHHLKRAVQVKPEDPETPQPPCPVCQLPGVELSGGHMGCEVHGVQELKEPSWVKAGYASPLLQEIGEAGDLTKGPKTTPEPTEAPDPKSKPMPKGLAYNVLPSDVDRRTFLHEGRWIDTEAICGRFQAQDVGKRIYHLGDGVYQIENQEQLEKRTSTTEAPKPAAVLYPQAKLQEPTKPLLTEEEISALLPDPEPLSEQREAFHNQMEDHRLSLLQERVKQLRTHVDTAKGQAPDGDYEHGMANGLIWALYIMEGSEGPPRYVSGEPGAIDASIKSLEASRLRLMDLVVALDKIASFTETTARAAIAKAKGEA